jgi:electron transfer flavoprotein beta subunit
MSVVPDTTTKITFKENNSKFNSDGVQFIINPYDELSLTKALEIAEITASTVTVINVGTDTEPVIRKALAIGANDAVRINTAPNDAFAVASEIAQYAKNENYDLIFTGRESIDFNGGLVGGLLAEMLAMPLLNIVTKVDIADGKVTATRDIDGGKEELSCSLPCVISAQKDLCEPRIPNMRGIMMARSKPLSMLEPTNANANADYSSFELPPAKAGVRLIDPENAGDLIDILHNEIKVI